MYTCICMYVYMYKYIYIYIYIYVYIHVHIQSEVFWDKWPLTFAIRTNFQPVYVVVARSDASRNLFGLYVIHETGSAYTRCHCRAFHIDCNIVLTRVCVLYNLQRVYFNSLIVFFRVRTNYGTKFGVVLSSSIGVTSFLEVFRDGNNASTLCAMYIQCVHCLHCIV